MERFARLRAEFRRQGVRIPDFDLIVAATALHHDLTVLTNDGHFRRVPGRKTKQIPREQGYIRLQITVRPDQVADLMSGQRVTLTRSIPTGEEFKVVLSRNR